LGNQDRHRELGTVATSLFHGEDTEQVSS